MEKLTRKPANTLHLLAHTLFERVEELNGEEAKNILYFLIGWHQATEDENFFQGLQRALHYFPGPQPD